MTSGTRTRAARLAVALIGAFVLAAASAAAQLDAPGLMQMLASVEAAHASFVETRYSPLLKSPLVSRGTLSYRRPDLLAQHVESPRDERFVLHGGRLTIETASGKRETTLASGDAGGVAALIEGVRWVRAGDLAALERSFTLSVSGTREHWTLRLAPRGAQLARYVREIAVAGSDARIERIEVREASGDRTVMDIRETLH